jgi:hypothetical protein
MQTIAILIVLFGAAFSCQKHVIAEPENNDAIIRAKEETLTIDAGMTLAQINAVIASANAGETVYADAGTYTITGKIVMKAGVNLAKLTTTNPVFSAASLSSILTLSYGAELNNCTISGITFWNIRMVITSAENVALKYCIFDYGKRAANTNKTNNLKDDYVELLSTDSSLVTNCVFCHRATDAGRGVWTKGTTNARILNNTFGNGGTTGYFVCAINDNSQSNSLISGNTLNRNTALNAIDSLTDHGMYCHSFTGLTITGNTVSGWPANASGGSIKARNGSNLTISNNTLNDAGIMLYEYVSNTAYPYLNNVVVNSNTINIATPASDIYHGIGYYRDNTAHSEYSINITGNNLPNGTIMANSSNINVTNFNAAGGGVYNNDVAAGYLLLKSGINNSGNY